MCNAYKIGPDASQQRLEIVSRIHALLPGREKRLIRKTDSAPVITSDGEARLMRWGFQRPFNPAINNARSDKLESGMWCEAWRERRCVIPMSLFYEWGPGLGSRKVPHEFRHTDGSYLWVAGLWEDDPQYGPCYTMITTDAPPIMAPIHDRMPALLSPEETRSFLSRITEVPRPFTGDLAVAPCDNPLVKPKDGGTQLDLF